MPKASADAENCACIACGNTKHAWLLARKPILGAAFEKQRHVLPGTRHEKRCPRCRMVTVEIRLIMRSADGSIIGEQVIVCVLYADDILVTVGPWQPGVPEVGVIL
jgi:hypothetical protein